jgi:hypothetical protein
MAEAIEWTTKFLKVLGGGECEIRPIFSAGDFPPDVLTPEQAKRDEAARETMKTNAAKR